MDVNGFEILLIAEMFFLCFKSGFFNVLMIMKINEYNWDRRLNDQQCIIFVGVATSIVVLMESYIILIIFQIAGDDWTFSLYFQQGGNYSLRSGMHWSKSRKVA